MTTALPDPLRERWRPVGTRTRRSRFALVSSTAETTLYEHVPTADALEAEGSLTAGEIPVRSLFAIELTMQPSLPSMGISPSSVLGMAAGQVRRQVASNLEGEGLVVEGERESTSFERADGTVGRRAVLETVARVDPGAADVETIDAETHVAVWPTDASYGVAGGTLPLEAPPGFEAALDVDPERDRETVLEFARTVVPGDGDGDEDGDGDGDDAADGGDEPG